MRLFQISLLPTHYCEIVPNQSVTDALLSFADFIPGIVRLFRLFGVVTPSQSVNTFFLGVVKSALEDRRHDQQNKRVGG